MGQKKWLISIILLVLIIVSGIFAWRVFFLYEKIINGQADDLAYDFSQEMSISKAIAAMEPSDQPATVVSSDDPRLGAEDPLLIIVEFADFQCPYCKQVSDTVRKLITIYQDQVQLIYRDFPASDIHPQAQRAAEAAGCAHEQDMFWQYHDKLFQNQNDLSENALKSYAIQIGLEMESFNLCFDYGYYRSEVNDDYADGVMAGVQGTPTFFFNGHRVAGAIPESIFEAIIIGFLGQL
ncbi:MAG: DsbA family protein [Candidatus Uhrbacteria bacterium]